MSRHGINQMAKLGAAGVLLAGFAVLVPAEQALAQRQGGGFGRFGMFNSSGINQIMLLPNESVQVELKLTDDQKTKAGAVVTKITDEMQSVREELGGLDPEDREAKMQELRKTLQEKGKAALGEVAEILKPEQMTRLKQISLQQRGIGALTDDEVAGELKLSDDQKKQITAINEQSSTEMRELFRQSRESGGDFQAVRTKVDEMRKAASDKAIAVLTPDQKAAYEKLQGPKAEIRLEGPPGGGRRRGQGA